ncbi:MAG: hypothetical protein FWC15_08365 [Fibromonadales bacterium]|nr:hypothetical protein [Fibromonadales bacterium]
MQVDRATELRDLRLFGALRHHCDRFGTGAKIGTIRLPNFKENNEGYTKTVPTRSDEEILKDIAELAKKHAEKGAFHNADNEYLDLMKEYISSVSPDRESILKNSLNEIFSKANSTEKPLSEMKKEHSQNILKQTLMAMEQMKNNNGGRARIWLDGEISGANYNVGWMEGDTLKNASFSDGNGELIACYDSKSGWSLDQTKAEMERSREITAVYNEAFNSVYKAPQASHPKHIEGGANIDVVG